MEFPYSSAWWHHPSSRIKRESRYINNNLPRVSVWPVMTRLGRSRSILFAGGRVTFSTYPGVVKRGLRSRTCVQTWKRFKTVIWRINRLTCPVNSGEVLKAAKTAFRLNKFPYLLRANESLNNANKRGMKCMGRLLFFSNFTASTKILMTIDFTSITRLSGRNVFSRFIVLQICRERKLFSYHHKQSSTLFDVSNTFEWNWHYERKLNRVTAFPSCVDTL